MAPCKIWDGIRTIFSLDRYILRFWLWLRLWLHQNFWWNQNAVFPRSVSFGGWVLLGILDRGVPPGYPSPDPISDQKMSFFTPIFRPYLKQYVSILDQNSNKKDFLQFITNLHFFFLSYSFEIETRNTFMHSPTSSKVIPVSRTKWERSIPISRPKQFKTPTLWGDTSLNFMRLLQVIITPLVTSESTSH